MNPSHNFSGLNEMNKLIEIQGLYKSFGDTTAVAGMDLYVYEGEMMGLIGPDGAGKTTTLRILCGLLRADQGTVVMAGWNVSREIKKIRRIIGYMPQRFSLYPDLTVSENLRFFSDLFQVSKQERETRLQRLLEFSRLGPFADRQAQALSGGMKQKLALSCTLIHTPKILLLDEPTTGVDPVSRREFWDILAELRSQGVTILVSTPYMDEAARCDRVAFIHRGKILSVNKPDEISQLYQGTLLEIRCRQNVAAARLLTASGRFASVQIFGDRLHVAGPEPADRLESLVKQILGSKEAALSVKKIPAGIEDVFVEMLK
jgi:ABC-2 type transport system ATP-binding protein